MFEKHRPDKPPGSTPRPEDKPRQARRRPRDIGREDADSPNAIPILPPRGDGS